MGYSPWVRKESDTTEHFHFSLPSELKFQPRYSLRVLADYSVLLFLHLKTRNHILAFGMKGY